MPVRRIDPELLREEGQYKYYPPVYGWPDVDREGPSLQELLLENKNKKGVIQKKQEKKKEEPDPRTWWEKLYKPDPREVKKNMDRIVQGAKAELPTGLDPQKALQFKYGEPKDFTPERVGLGLKYGKLVIEGDKIYRTRVINGRVEPEILPIAVINNKGKIQVFQYAGVDEKKFEQYTSKSRSELAKEWKTDPFEAFSQGFEKSILAPLTTLHNIFGNKNVRYEATHTPFITHGKSKEYEGYRTAGEITGEISKAILPISVGSKFKTTAKLLDKPWKVGTAISGIQEIPQLAKTLHDDEMQPFGALMTTALNTAANIAGVKSGVKSAEAMHKAVAAGSYSGVGKAVAKEVARQTAIAAVPTAQQQLALTAAKQPFAEQMKQHGFDYETYSDFLKEYLANLGTVGAINIITEIMGVGGAYRANKTGQSGKPLRNVFTEFIKSGKERTDAYFDKITAETSRNLPTKDWIETAIEQARKDGVVKNSADEKRLRKQLEQYRRERVRVDAADNIINYFNDAKYEVATSEDIEKVIQNAKEKGIIKNPQDEKDLYTLLRRHITDPEETYYYIDSLIRRGYTKDEILDIFSKKYDTKIDGKRTIEYLDPELAKRFKGKPEELRKASLATVEKIYDHIAEQIRKQKEGFGVIVEQPKPETEAEPQTQIEPIDAVPDRKLTVEDLDNFYNTYVEKYRSHVIDGLLNPKVTNNRAKASALLNIYSKITGEQPFGKPYSEIISRVEKHLTGEVPSRVIEKDPGLNILDAKQRGDVVNELTSLGDLKYITKNILDTIEEEALNRGIIYSNDDINRKLSNILGIKKEKEIVNFTDLPDNNARAEHIASRLNKNKTYNELLLAFKKEFGDLFKEDLYKSKISPAQKAENEAETVDITDSEVKEDAAAEPKALEQAEQQQLPEPKEQKELPAAQEEGKVETKPEELTPEQEALLKAKVNKLIKKKNIEELDAEMAVRLAQYPEVAYIFMNKARQIEAAKDVTAQVARDEFVNLEKRIQSGEYKDEGVISLIAKIRHYANNDDKLLDAFRKYLDNNRQLPVSIKGHITKLLNSGLAEVKSSYTQAIEDIYNETGDILFKYLTGRITDDLRRQVAQGEPVEVKAEPQTEQQAVQTEQVAAEQPQPPQQLTEPQQVAEPKPEEVEQVAKQVEQPQQEVTQQVEQQAEQATAENVETPPVEQVEVKAEQETPQTEAVKAAEEQQAEPPKTEQIEQEPPEETQPKVTVDNKQDIARYKSEGLSEKFAKKYVNELRELETVMGGKKRKDGSPMYLHSARVAELVNKFGGTEREVRAAMFHDAFEDAVDINYARQITDKYGITDLVEQCTYQGEYATKDERKKANVARWLQSDYSVRLIKAADVIDNLKNNPTDYYISWATPFLRGLLEHKDLAHIKTKVGIPKLLKMDAALPKQEVAPKTEEKAPEVAITKEQAQKETEKETNVKVPPKKLKENEKVKKIKDEIKKVEEKIEDIEKAAKGDVAALESKEAEPIKDNEVKQSKRGNQGKERIPKEQFDLEAEINRLNREILVLNDTLLQTKDAKRAKQLQLEIKDKKARISAIKRELKKKGYYDPKKFKERVIDKILVGLGDATNYSDELLEINNLGDKLHIRFKHTVRLPALRDFAEKFNILEEELTKVFLGVSNEKSIKSGTTLTLTLTPQNVTKAAIKSLGDEIAGVGLLLYGASQSKDEEELEQSSLLSALAMVAGTALVMRGAARYVATKPDSKLAKAMERVGISKMFIDIPIENDKIYERYKNDLLRKTQDKEERERIIERYAQYERAGQDTKETTLSLFRSLNHIQSETQPVMELKSAFYKGKSEADKALQNIRSLQDKYSDELSKFADNYNRVVGDKSKADLQNILIKTNNDIFTEAINIIRNTEGDPKPRLLLLNEPSSIKNVLRENGIAEEMLDDAYKVYQYQRDLVNELTKNQANTSLLHKYGYTLNEADKVLERLEQQVNITKEEIADIELRIAKKIDYIKNTEKYQKLYNAEGKNINKAIKDRALAEKLINKDEELLLLNTQLKVAKKKLENYKNEITAIEDHQEFIEGSALMNYMPERWTLQRSKGDYGLSIYMINNEGKRLSSLDDKINLFKFFKNPEERNKFLSKWLEEHNAKALESPDYPNVWEIEYVDEKGRTIKGRVKIKEDLNVKTIEMLAAQTTAAMRRRFFALLRKTADYNINKKELLDELKQLKAEVPSDESVPVSEFDEVTTKTIDDAIDMLEQLTVENIDTSVLNDIFEYLLKPKAKRLLETKNTLGYKDPEDRWIDIWDAGLQKMVNRISAQYTNGFLKREIEKQILETKTLGINNHYTEFLDSIHGDILYAPASKSFADNVLSPSFKRIWQVAESIGTAGALGWNILSGIKNKLGGFTTAFTQLVRKFGVENIDKIIKAVIKAPRGEIKFLRNIHDKPIYGNILDDIRAKIISEGIPETTAVRSLDDEYSNIMGKVSKVKDKLYALMRLTEISNRYEAAMSFANAYVEIYPFETSGLSRPDYVDMVTKKAAMFVGESQGMFDFIYRTPVEKFLIKEVPFLGKSFLTLVSPTVNQLALMANMYKAALVAKDKGVKNKAIAGVLAQVIAATMLGGVEFIAGVADALKITDLLTEGDEKTIDKLENDLRRVLNRVGMYNETTDAIVKSLRYGVISMLSDIDLHMDISAYELLTPFMFRVTMETFTKDLPGIIEKGPEGLVDVLSKRFVSVGRLVKAGEQLAYGYETDKKGNPTGDDYGVLKAIKEGLFGEGLTERYKRYVANTKNLSYLTEQGKRKFLGELLNGIERGDYAKSEIEELVDEITSDEKLVRDYYYKYLDVKESDEVQDLIKDNEKKLDKYIKSNMREIYPLIMRGDTYDGDNKLFARRKKILFNYIKDYVLASKRAELLNEMFSEIGYEVELPSKVEVYDSYDLSPYLEDGDLIGNYPEEERPFYYALYKLYSKQKEEE